MTAQRIADELLWPIWRGVDDGYKRKYARTIWGQLEDQIKSSAYTSSLPRFLENVTRRLGVQWANSQDAALVAAFLQIPVNEARESLNILRSESAAAILLVRLKNEDRKADYQAKQEAKRKEEAQADADVLL